MLAKPGVDTEHVVWTDNDRVGVYFSSSAPLRVPAASCTIAKIRPSRTLAPAWFPGRRCSRRTLVSCHRDNASSQSDAAADATAEALKAAKAAGLRTSIDLNYRAKLWTPAEAGRRMSEFMPYCDVLITTEEDVDKVFQIKGENYETVAAQSRQAVLPEGGRHHPAGKPAGLEK